ncbi:CNDH2_C domain-containing protein, partial [Caerostris extrusa]
NLSPGIENIPLDDADVAPKPRRSMRNALKVCQLDGEPTNAAQNQVDMVAIRKLIQKKNTCNLPAKLKGEEILALNPASEFCARAYFGLDENLKQKVCLPTFGVSSFVCNSKIRGKLLQIYDRMLLRREKRGGAPIPVPDGEDNDVDIDRVENLNDPDPDNMFETPNLEAPDIAVENDLVQPIPLISDENPIAEEEPVMNGNDGNDDSYDMIEDSFEAAAKLQCRIFKEELIHYVRTSDIAEKLIEWEKTVKPFLEKLKGRENFDINLYGSRILNSFSDNNRKQTVTFRNFCQGKEKWEIHRYFMALLPLVNVGNVTIETDELSDGDEDILVTLLSRKMHHKELEEFGHGEGEHTS